VIATMHENGKLRLYEMHLRHILTLYLHICRYPPRCHTLSLGYSTRHLQ
jgi:hypothetical protein